MTEYNFKQHMQRMREVYGEKHYSKERLAIYWEIVKEIEDNDFGNWVSMKIADSKFAPLGEDFRIFAKEYEKKKFESYALTNQVQGRQHSCSLCAGEGALLAERVSDKTKWAFLCSCESAKNSHWAQRKKTKEDPDYWALPKWERVSGTGEYLALRNF